MRSLTGPSVGCRHHLAEDRLYQTTPCDQSVCAPDYRGTRGRQAARHRTWLPVISHCRSTLPWWPRSRSISIPAFPATTVCQTALPGATFQQVRMEEEKRTHVQKNGYASRAFRDRQGSAELEIQPRRQPKTRFAFTSCRRATTETPG